MKVDGKTAVVTGAASGLGLATCRVLAAAGARIAALDRDVAGLEILRGNTGWFARAVDVTDESSMKAALDEVVEAVGRPYIAVSCAGVADAAKTVSKGKPFPLPVWDKVIAINLTGAFNLIRLSAVFMVQNEPDPESGERGVIVSTASGAATQGQVGQAAYSASKAGVIGLTLPVARDLAPHGIRAVAISPGVFETATVARLPPQVKQSLIEKTILFPNRMGQALEFGELVRHIAENAYLNATTIDLDGGARMTAR